MNSVICIIDSINVVIPNICMLVMKIKYFFQIVHKNAKYVSHDKRLSMLGSWL